jgi:hypothetical protein
LQKIDWVCRPVAKIAWWARSRLAYGRDDDGAVVIETKPGLLRAARDPRPD